MLTSGPGLLNSRKEPRYRLNRRLTVLHKEDVWEKKKYIAFAGIRTPYGENPSLSLYSLYRLL